MAESFTFEPYHVPQQSRRDKLRVVVGSQSQQQQQQPSDHHLQGCVGLYYDQSSLLSSSDFATSEASKAIIKEENHNHSHNPNPNPNYNFMAFVASASSTSSGNHHHSNSYFDPHSSTLSLPLNPNPFLYNNFQNIGVVEPLALSLSSHTNNNNNNNNSNNNLPLELNNNSNDNLQRYSMVAGIVGGGGGGSSTSNDNNNEVSRSAVPLGPFTGYASVLKGSRFLKPAQQLLEEFCNVGRGIYGEKAAVITNLDASLLDPPIECLSAAAGNLDDSVIGSGGDGGETRRRKSRLISMLDEVYRRYKQYYQQIQAVVASFDCVAGLGNAAPYANLALKAMSKHFRALKNAITDQLQFTNKAYGHGKEEAARFGNTDRGLYGQRPVHNSGFIEHQPVWRPQRGLPERAVTVLRAWLFEHFLHPYPTDTDKIMLAKQTGLSRSQVSNWFINARVRLWKPMVEEIHMLETQQAQKPSQREDRNANRSSAQVTMSNSVMCEHPSTSAQRIQDVPSKRTRNELSGLPEGSEEPLNLSYNSLSSHPHVGVGLSMAGGPGNVSLTLGLHQNNGIGLSEPFPINAAQRFGLGLESSGEGYVMAGFETQNRHFVRDVIGGQLLHDFVG